MNLKKSVYVKNNLDSPVRGIRTGDVLCYDFVGIAAAAHIAQSPIQSKTNALKRSRELITAWRDVSIKTTMVHANHTVAARYTKVFTFLLLLLI